MKSRAENRRVSVDVETLISRSQRGDKLALSALVQRYQNYVFRLCYLVMHNEQDAEDMTQETFIRACRALPRFQVRPGASFEAWLYRIAVNCCRSRIRRKWYQVLPWPNPAPDLASAPENQPDRVVMDGEYRDEMLSAIDTLGEKHRLVVILRYYAGLSNEEIAMALNIPSGTVRSRLHTARQRLKKLIATDDQQDRERALSRSIG